MTHFSAVRLKRIPNTPGLPALHAASRHANRKDETSKIRVRPGADSSRNLHMVPWGETNGGKIDYVAAYERRKAATGARERGNTAPVINLLCVVSPGWVKETGDLHDPENPRNVMLHAAAIDWAAAVFGKDAILDARLDLDEKGGGVVDVFIAPVAQSKRKRTLYFSSAPVLRAVRAKHKARNTYAGLQDSWSAFVKRELDKRIERGKIKEGKGPDRLSPEIYGARKDNLREQARLQEVERALSDKESDLALAMIALEADRQAMAEEVARLRAEREEIEKERALLAAERRQLDDQSAVVKKLKSQLVGDLATVQRKAAQVSRERAEVERIKEQAQKVAVAEAERTLATAQAEAAAIRHAADEDRKAAAVLRADIVLVAAGERERARAQGLEAGRRLARDEALSKQQALSRVIENVADSSISRADLNGDIQLGRAPTRNQEQIKADMALAMPDSAKVAARLIEIRRGIILEQLNENQATRKAVQNVTQAAISGLLAYDEASKGLRFAPDADASKRASIEADLRRAPIVKEIAIAAAESKRLGFKQGVQDGIKRALEGFNLGVRALLERKLSFGNADKSGKAPDLLLSEPDEAQREIIKKAIAPLLSAGLKDLLWRLHRVVMHLGDGHKALKRAREGFDPMSR